MSTDSTTNVIPLHSKTEGLDAEVLRERVRTAIDADGINQRKVAREAGLSQPTLTQWLGGKYPGDNASIEAKLEKWLLARVRRDAANRPKGPQWFSSPSADKVLDALSQCQIVGDIVCVYGGPGVGKTVTLRHYQRKNPAVWIATMAPDCAGVIPALEEIAEAVGLRETVQGARRLARAIRKKIEDTAGLLIIDEAQHLSVAALEEVRSIHDATGIGLALVGNESVYSRLTGGTRSSHFAQLFSRIGARLYLRRPTVDDVDALAEAWNVKGHDEIDFLKQIATKPGALRGCTKTLMLASMSREKGSLTIQQLRQAWQNLGAQE